MYQSCSAHCLIYWSADRVLYSDERLVKIAEEAAKKDSVFSLDDRIGLVLDAPALSQAGYTKTSSTLALVNALRDETNCLFFYLLISML